jgi:hypothetical protein
MVRQFFGFNFNKGGFYEIGTTMGSFGVFVVGS